MRGYEFEKRLNRPLRRLLYTDRSPEHSAQSATHCCRRLLAPPEGAGPGMGPWDEVISR